MIVGVLWLVLSLAVAVLAYRYGRAVPIWFILSVFLSPVLAGGVLLGLGENVEKVSKPREIWGDYRSCPRCDRRIKASAVTCRHCGWVQPD